jgi:hypothetical protein
MSDNKLIGGDAFKYYAAGCKEKGVKAVTRSAFNKYLYDQSIKAKKVKNPRGRGPSMVWGVTTAALDSFLKTHKGGFGPRKAAAPKAAAAPKKQAAGKKQAATKKAAPKKRKGGRPSRIDTTDKILRAALLAGLAGERDLTLDQVSDLVKKGAVGSTLGAATLGDLIDAAHG